jgi:hypothetical protein
MDLFSTRAVCGPLPWTMTDGVAATVKWLRSGLGQNVVDLA